MQCVYIYINLYMSIYIYIYIYIWLRPKTYWIVGFNIIAPVPSRSVTFCHVLPYVSDSVIRSDTFQLSSVTFCHMFWYLLCLFYTFCHVLIAFHHVPPYVFEESTYFVYVLSRSVQQLRETEKSSIRTSLAITAAHPILLRSVTFHSRSVTFHEGVSNWNVIPMTMRSDCVLYNSHADSQYMNMFHHVPMRSSEPYW
jgi:hypothetical protein